MRAQVIAKSEMIQPERTPHLRQVKMVLARIPAPKEIPARNSLFTTIRIACCFKSLDNGFTRFVGKSAGKYIHDGFRRETGDRGAAGVLEHERHIVLREHMSYTCGFGGVKSGPRGIVGNHSNRTRFETK